MKRRRKTFDGTNIDIIRICIHECSHAVAAQLFSQRMTMEGLVVNTDLIKGDQDLATCNVRGPRLDDEQDYIALAITYLAGVVGENIYILGADAIKGKKGEKIADNSIMDWSSGGGDMPAFKNLAFVFSLSYQFDEYKLKEFCLRFLIDFLSDKEVWSVVEKLCEELLGTDDLKLSEDKLESVFGQIGFDNNKRTEYLKQLDGALKLCE